MNAMLQMRVMLDPSEILRVQGMEPDSWQREFLLCEDRAQMLCCCRGAGKSRTTAAKATHRALFRKKSLILLISRAQRQAGELFRYVKEAYRALKGADALDESHKAVKWTETQQRGLHSSGSEGTRSGVGEPGIRGDVHGDVGAEGTAGAGREPAGPGPDGA